MIGHFADRLHAAIRLKRTPLCVGLDPRWELLPLGLRKRFPDSPSGRARAYAEFCWRVIELIEKQVAVVKPQVAFFEALGPAGNQALLEVIQAAHAKHLLVILDAKRGDIASTAEAYAEMAFHAYRADALTVNPFLGRDSIEPFLKVARQSGQGLFVLVRTSNAGASQFQDLDCGGLPLYRKVAEAVAQWSAEKVGADGYGDVGAVVGATNPKELVELRRLLPGVLMLVPGYGAQGGKVADVKPAFDAGGRGAVVNSSRGVTFPFKPDALDWQERISLATQQAAEELAAAAGLKP